VRAVGTALEQVLASSQPPPPPAAAAAADGGSRGHKTHQHTVERMQSDRAPNCGPKQVAPVSAK